MKSYEAGSFAWPSPGGDLRGEATIQYLDGGIPLTRSFEAEWLGVELGLGVQRIFKEFDSLIWPYVGVEAGPVFWVFLSI